ncbi:hypothetical protein [Nocardia nova]|uniref:hypothetical protein n=1 Tax=Nocardia nova TaxID=37330 RepID=UPI002739D3E9|nr:hypothetical protein [Nocardia nova]
MYSHNLDLGIDLRQDVRSELQLPEGLQWVIGKEFGRGQEFRYALKGHVILDLEGLCEA